MLNKMAVSCICNSHMETFLVMFGVIFYLNVCIACPGYKLIMYFTCNCFISVTCTKLVSVKICL